MVVGLTGGTTTTEVARALAAGRTCPAGPDGAQLTVVTNALNIANELVVRSRMKIVVTGGVVRPQSYELVGPLATGILRELTLDMAFLGVDAVDATLGAASHHEGEAAMNSLLASRARRVVVIADCVQAGPARLRPGLPGRAGGEPRHGRRRDRRARWRRSSTPVSRYFGSAGCVYADALRLARPTRRPGSCTRLGGPGVMGVSLRPRLSLRLPARRAVAGCGVEDVLRAGAGPEVDTVSPMAAG